MFRLVSSKTVRLTMSLAREMATHPRGPGERPVRDKRRARVRGLILHGLFCPPLWAVATIKTFPGKTFRVNGQCSSEELVKSGKSFPQDMTAHFDVYECDRQEDYQLLFSQFDPTWSSRNRAERIGVEIASHKELTGVDCRGIQMCLQGISYSLKNDPFDALSMAGEQHTLVHKYPAFLVWAQEFAGVPLLFRNAIMAVIFETWRIDPDAAVEFWRLVRDASHPTPSHPTRVLHSAIDEGIVTKKIITFATDNSSQWGRRAMNVKCKLAWNAYCTSTPTSLRYMVSTAMPDLAIPAKAGSAIVSQRRPRRSKTDALFVN